jgi:hypothetical protein
MRTTSRILIAGIFLLSLMIGTDVTAQRAALPSTSGISQQTPPSSKGAQNHANVESNPACQRILSECKRLGFIQGQWKKDNGLWKDCFDPIVKGSGNTTRDGKPITVPVSSSDVQACRASEGHHAGTVKK